MWVAISLYAAAGLTRAISSQWAILVAAAITMPMVAAVVALVPREGPENVPENVPEPLSKVGGFLGALIMWSGSAVLIGPWLFGPAGDKSAFWCALNGIALVPLGIFYLLVPHLRAGALTTLQRFLLLCFLVMEIDTLLLSFHMVMLSGGVNAWFLFSGTGVVFGFIISRIAWHLLRKQNQAHSPSASVLE
jgi:hypothetical protein